MGKLKLVIGVAVLLVAVVGGMVIWQSLESDDPLGTLDDRMDGFISNVLPNSLEDLDLPFDARLLSEEQRERLLSGVSSVQELYNELMGGGNTVGSQEIEFGTPEDLGSGSSGVDINESGPGPGSSENGSGSVESGSGSGENGSGSGENGSGSGENGSGSGSYNPFAFANQPQPQPVELDTEEGSSDVQWGNPDVSINDTLPSDSGGSSSLILLESMIDDTAPGIESAPGIGSGLTGGSDGTPGDDTTGGSSLDLVMGDDPSGIGSGDNDTTNPGITTLDGDGSSVFDEDTGGILDPEVLTLEGDGNPDGNPSPLSSDIGDSSSTSTENDLEVEPPKTSDSLLANGMFLIPVGVLVLAVILRVVVLVIERRRYNATDN